MKFGIEKILIFILIIAVVATFGFLFYLLTDKISKNIKISFPSGGEELMVGDTYKIEWKARGINKVGIILYKDQTARWIAKDLDASIGEYEWKVYPGQEYGDNFWIAVVEFPWQKNRAVAYTDGSFALVYPKTNSCDVVSVQNQWAYIPSDYPNIRKVFITKNSFTGNLGGIEGADKKCQEEARSQGYNGTYRSFIGGDSDSELAVQRIRKTMRGVNGIFVEAKSAMQLANGVGCQALLGNNLTEFMANFSNPAVVNKEKFSAEFFRDFGAIWLGRVDDKSKNSCAIIGNSASGSGNAFENISERSSFTSTCQRWTSGSQFVSGYPVPEGSAKPSFPSCYVSSGNIVDAVAVGGLSMSLTSDAQNLFTPYQAKTCDSYQKLLCIED